MKVIGFTGFAGSGKDTAALMLLRQRSGYQRAFADPMREVARAVFGLTADQMNDRVKKEQVVPYWGLSPREILQRIGTECVREVFGADTWVKCMALRLEMLLADDALEPVGSDCVVFTDVRTDEEARFVRSKGGVVINVVRPGVGPVNDHVTDQGISAELVDFVLENNAGLDELDKAVKWGCDAWFDRAVDMCDLRRAA
jgi:hypothetical protein